ncbi:hypothetical protein ACFWD1_12195 [Micromonospora chalcea]
MIVVLGEDDNDRQAIRVLVAALRADIGRGGLKPLRTPMALVRNVPPERLPRHADKVRAMLKALAVATPIRAVLVHEDADEVEPAHETVIAKIEQTFRSLPWPVHAVVPAWEIETWWFLFPDAVRQVCPGWRSLSSYAGRDVGRIRHAKQELVRALTPPGARKSTFRTYSEADSVQIAERVVALGQLAPPWFAHSKSWLAFLGTVDSL